MQALLEAGIPKETIVEWSKDPKVELDGESTGFFDCMEDLNVKVRMPLSQCPMLLSFSNFKGPFNILRFGESWGVRWAHST